jgi:hypothetical protein
MSWCTVVNNDYEEDMTKAKSNLPLAFVRGSNAIRFKSSTETLGVKRQGI